MSWDTGVYKIMCKIDNHEYDKNDNIFYTKPYIQYDKSYSVFHFRKNCCRIQISQRYTLNKYICIDDGTIYRHIEIDGYKSDQYTYVEKINNNIVKQLLYNKEYSKNVSYIQYDNDSNFFEISKCNINIKLNGDDTGKLKIGDVTYDIQDNYNDFYLIEQFKNKVYYIDLKQDLEHYSIDSMPFLEVDSNKIIFSNFSVDTNIQFIKPNKTNEIEFIHNYQHRINNRTGGPDLRYLYENIFYLELPYYYQLQQDDPDFTKIENISQIVVKINMVSLQFVCSYPCISIHIRKDKYSIIYISRDDYTYYEAHYNQGVCKQFVINCKKYFVCFDCSCCNVFYCIDENFNITLIKYTPNINSDKNKCYIPTMLCITTINKLQEDIGKLKELLQCQYKEKISDILWFLDGQEKGVGIKGVASKYDEYARLSGYYKVYNNNFNASISN